MILKDVSKGKIPKEQVRKIFMLMKKNDEKILKSKFLEEFSKNIELNELLEKTYRNELYIFHITMHGVRVYNG